MKSRTVERFVLLLLIPTLVVQAMFFTNSKDNDYPRIGKRILPPNVYKTWYQQNLPKSYGGHQRSRHERIIRLDQKPGYYVNLQDSPAPDGQLEPDARKGDNIELYNAIWSYIRPEEELDY